MMAGVFRFPLLMNGMQFWIVDTIVKVTPTEHVSGTYAAPTKQHQVHGDEEQGLQQQSSSSSPPTLDERTPLLDDRS